MNKKLNFEEVLEDHHEEEYAYGVSNGLSDPENYNIKRNCNSAECINKGRKKDLDSTSSVVEKFEKPKKVMTSNFGHEDLSNLEQKDSINEDNATKKDSCG